MQRVKLNVLLTLDLAAVVMFSSHGNTLTHDKLRLVCATFCVISHLWFSIWTSNILIKQKLYTEIALDLP